MTNLEILGKEEVRKFENPPVLSGIERKKYFRITQHVSEYLKSMRNDHTKAGFLLHLGYFKATGKFYTAQSFLEQDINYVAKQLRIQKVNIDLMKYHRVLFHRHKKLILEICGYMFFEDCKSVFENHLQQLITKHLTPKKIFYAVTEWLRMQKIEVPSYYQLVTSITQDINSYEKQLFEKLETLLSDKQKL